MYTHNMAAVTHTRTDVTDIMSPQLLESAGAAWA